MVNTMNVAKFIAKHPIYDEKVHIAHAWAYALSYTQPMFDKKAFVEACGVKYQKPLLESHRPGGKP